MRHRLWAILCGVSLLMCIGVVALWVRSEFAADLLLRRTGYVGTAIRSDRGVIVYSRSEGLPRADDDRWHWQTEKPGWAAPEAGRWIGRLGFGSDQHDEFLMPAGPIPQGVFFSPRVIPVSEYWIPHWSAAALSTVLPLIALARYWRRSRRSARGLCLECGYDLRASTGRCPECGTAVPMDVHPHARD